jgi:hypothetical protein
MTVKEIAIKYIKIKERHNHPIKIKSTRMSVRICATFLRGIEKI